MNYKESFVELVRNSKEKSDIFYSVKENENLPNPYYIGFGNPNARVLVIGKEKAFNIKDKEGKIIKKNLNQLHEESIDNPSQWNAKLKGEEDSYKFNPEKPYDDHIQKEGRNTWRIIFFMKL